MASIIPRVPAIPCAQFNQGTCENQEGCQYSHVPDSFSLGSGGRNVCLGYLIGRCDGWGCYYSHNKEELLWADEDIRTAIQERMSLIDSWNAKLSRMFSIAPLYHPLAVGFSIPRPPQLAPSQTSYPTPYSSTLSPADTSENPDLEPVVESEEEEPIEANEPTPAYRFNPAAAEFIPQYQTSTPSELVDSITIEEEETKQNQTNDDVAERHATQRDLELWTVPQGDIQAGWDDTPVGDQEQLHGGTASFKDPPAKQSVEQKARDNWSSGPQKQNTYEGWGSKHDAEAEASWLGGPSVDAFGEPSKKVVAPTKPFVPKKPETKTQKKAVYKGKGGPSNKHLTKAPSSTPSQPKYANSKLKRDPLKPVAAWAESKPAESARQEPPHFSSEDLDDLKYLDYKLPPTPGTPKLDQKMIAKVVKASAELHQRNYSAGSLPISPPPIEERQEVDPGMRWVNGEPTTIDQTPDTPRNFASRSKGHGSTSSWVS